MELAKASGIETPRREDLAKLDRKRAGKGSNRVWKHPHDADARITRMKDGRTHLAHTAEHAVDLETGAIVSVTVQEADRGDTQTMVKTLTEAAEKVEQALPEGRGIEEVVADKGYHSTQRMVDLEAVGLRSYVSEPRRGKRRWRGDRQAQQAVYANRRRIRGERGQRLLRQRGERLERPCAHLYGSGGMRRLHVRGHENVLKRLLIQVSAFNLGMLMRQSLGVGTPRGLQGRICALNVIDFLAVQAFSGPVQTDCGRSAQKVGVKVAIAAATGAYRLSSENVLLPRAASPFVEVEKKSEYGTTHIGNSYKRSVDAEHSNRI